MSTGTSGDSTGNIEAGTWNALNCLCRKYGGNNAHTAANAPELPASIFRDFDQVSPSDLASAASVSGAATGLSCEDATAVATGASLFSVFSLVSL